MSLAERHDMMENAAWTGGDGSVGDYIALMKPRVMSLVIFTAFVGLMLAPGSVHPVIGAVAILCIAIGAGASGALNMWYDADIDEVMSRTRKRPIPSGKITPEEALAFGMTLSIGSVVTLGLLVNWFAGAFLAFTIFFYAVIYTMWLKRSTPQNIVIGGAAGAFPPMIGWASVTGTVSLESFVLFLIIFMWTPPHFWALALFKKGDYETAGVPMLPNVAGEMNTRHQILAYSIILAPVGVAPYIMGYAGLAYGIASALLGLVFLVLALDVWRKREGTPAQKACLKLFKFSIFYLFALFALLLGENLVTGVMA
ncbi:protoheme IX farnesyltransferase [Roseibium denhamense]|uniref:Protoheme IX farnesyltransferase n=1 Tax=Roseibium denhamense TaxID=76305 RepID=A0ABY1P497_9HYPH|nr:heme o synthase [Roseibium denhamense]MTI07721.1 protoheme IX farnesyltransferase [Roseibium denhamense]SMP24858.1 protoheme IX farnesyltransferase [Roseibium denhamense]